jgi:anti-sigma B factor antagonist
MAPGDPGPAVSRPPMVLNESNPADEAFTIERRGELTVITATEALERIEFGLEETVSELILKPLRRQVQPQIVVDLSRVGFFGSMFLALLIRCWKLVVSRGGSMVLSGVDERSRELLRVTSLDQVWPMYQSKREAIEALQLD